MAGVGPQRHRKEKKPQHQPYTVSFSYGYEIFLVRCVLFDDINLLTPNANYSGRTAPLTSKVAFYIFIQQI